MAGHFPPPKDGMYDMEAFFSGLIGYLKQQNTKKTDSARQADVRLKNAKADMAEEQLAAFKEKYVLKSAIGPALRNLAARQRDVLQFKLEQEIAPNLSGKKPPEVLAIMQSAVDSICLLFENGIRPWLDDNSNP